MFVIKKENERNINVKYLNIPVELNFKINEVFIKIFDDEMKFSYDFIKEGEFTYYLRLFLKNLYRELEEGIIFDEFDEKFNYLLKLHFGRKNV